MSEAGLPIPAEARAGAPVGGRGTNAVASDTIAGWLSLLERMLRMPEAQTKEIRDELESHVRDRARDFMLAGLDAEESARRAIAELGETAELAERFRATRGESRRRQVMAMTSIGLAAGAAVVSIAALLQGGLGGGAAGGGAAGQVSAERADSVQAERDALRAEVEFLQSRIAFMAEHQNDALQVQAAEYEPREGPGLLADVKVKGEFKDTPLEEVLEALGKAAKDKPAAVRWGQLDALGIARDASITIPKGEYTLPQAFDWLNEAIGEGIGEERLDYRVSEAGQLEVATRKFFEKRETTLVAYDLAAILDRGMAGERNQGAMMERIARAVEEIAYPEGWEDNGGDQAKLHAVGSTLFVKAPPRYHHFVGWIIERLSRSEQAMAPGAGEAVSRIALSRLNAMDVIGDGWAEGKRVKMSADSVTNTVILCGPKEDVDRCAVAILHKDRLETAR